MWVKGAMVVIGVVFLCTFWKAEGGLVHFLVRRERIVVRDLLSHRARVLSEVLTAGHLVVGVFVKAVLVMTEWVLMVVKCSKESSKTARPY
jgi:hypothetical protein